MSTPDLSTNSNRNASQATVQPTGPGFKTLGSGTKIENNNPILLIHASLYKYNDVNEMSQTTHLKNSMFKSLIEPKDFPNKVYLDF